MGAVPVSPSMLNIVRIAARLRATCTDNCCFRTPRPQTLPLRPLQSPRREPRRRAPSNPGPGFACRLSASRAAQASASSVKPSAPLLAPSAASRDARTHARTHARSHVIRTRARRCPPSAAALAARRVLPSRDALAHPPDVSPKADSCATADNYHPARASARPVPAWPYARERDLPESVVFALRAHPFVLCPLPHSAAIPNGNEKPRLQPPAMGTHWRHRGRSVCSAPRRPDARRRHPAPGRHRHGRYVRLAHCLLVDAVSASTSNVWLQRWCRLNRVNRRVGMACR